MKLIPLSLSLLLLTQLISTADPAVEKPGGDVKTIPGLGSITDPNGDCQITGDSTRLAISIPGSDHALVTEQKRMNAPRVLQEVSGDFSAQVKISGNYPENASTIVPGRIPFQGAGLLLWADSDTYVRLEKAQLKVDQAGQIHHFTYPSWELRFAGKPLRMGGTSGKPYESAEMTLRITRKGNTVTGAVSEDGTTWQELDPLTVKLPEKVQVGVIAGHNTTSPIEAKFENFSVTRLAKQDQ
jgi:regulation of enolase protein 1 (concanavalin A-like superfamily)